MKRLSPIRRRQAAFTLTEIMVSMAIIMIVIAGVTLGHITGLKMYGLTKAKLGASNMARDAISKLIEEVRCAADIDIGNGNLSTFAQCAMDTPQQGTAIQIYPSTATNEFIRYYFDTNTFKLLRTTNNTTAKEIVAEYITNTVVFTSEDSFSNIITNNRNNRVIGLTLQFFQIQYPITTIGQGSYFDFYQLRTKITRRTLQ